MGMLPESAAPLLSGAIIVDSQQSIGEFLETKGRVTGLELNKNVRIDLDKPDGLDNKILIHGCGILREGEYEKGDQGENLSVVSLIENLSDREIKLEDHKWMLRMPFLLGTILFVKPKMIPPKAKCAVFGRLTQGMRNPDTVCRIRPVFPDKIDSGLKFIGFNLMGPATVELWFKNDSPRSIDPKVNQWLIETAGSRLVFRVNIPEIQKAAIASVSVDVDGVRFDPTEILAITPPEDLSDKFSARFDNEIVNSDRLSFVVWNKDKTKHRIETTWTIGCPFFTATLELEHVEIEPKSVKKVGGEVVGINWVKCLDLKPPSDWNSALRLVSYNILDRNNVSMIFKNTGLGQIASNYGQWKYIVPTINPNVTELSKALNSLIFSYLVLDPSQFPKLQDNGALKLIKERFEKLGLKIDPRHEPGTVSKV